MFIPLFPLGTLAEMALMWTALPELQVGARVCFRGF